MNTNLTRSLRRTRGFTTTELMVAVGILGLTMAATVAFTFQAMNVFAYDTGRLLVNHDIRKFTGDMVTDAVYANYFQIFQDFSTRGVAKADGQTGDFLLLVSTGVNTSGNTVVTKLVGYYRDATTTTVGPVRRFSHDWVDVAHGVIIGSPTNAGLTPPVYTMSDLLDTFAPTGGSSSNGIVIQLAQGLSSGNMFYNFKDHSVMIRSQINEQGSMIRKAVNTYNFTVSPRG